MQIFQAARPSQFSDYPINTPSIKPFENSISAQFTVTLLKQRHCYSLGHGYSPILHVFPLFDKDEPMIEIKIVNT